MLIAYAENTHNISIVILSFTLAIVTRNLTALGVELSLIDLSPGFCGN